MPESHGEDFWICCVVPVCIQMVSPVRPPVIHSYPQRSPQLCVTGSPGRQPAETENGCRPRRRRSERMWFEHRGGRGPESVVCAGPLPCCQVENYPSRQHQVSLDQRRVGPRQSAEELFRHRPRRIADHPERLSGKTEPQDIDAQDLDTSGCDPVPRRGATEPGLQPVEPVWVQLGCHYPGTCGNQRSGDGAITGAEVQHQVAGRDGRLPDQVSSRSGSEPMPSPESDGGSGCGTYGLPRFAGR